MNLTPEQTQIVERFLADKIAVRVDPKPKPKAERCISSARAKQ